MFGAVLTLGAAMPGIIERAKNTNWSNPAEGAAAAGRIAAEALGFGEVVDTVELLLGQDAHSKEVAAYKAARAAHEAKFQAGLEAVRLANIRNQGEHYASQQGNRVGQAAQQAYEKKNFGELLRQRNTKYGQSTSGPVIADRESAQFQQAMKNDIINESIIANKYDMKSKQLDQKIDNITSAENALQQKEDATNQAYQDVTNKMLSKSQTKANALQLSYEKAAAMKKAAAEAAAASLNSKMKLQSAATQPLRGRGKDSLQLHAIIVKKPSTKEEALHVANNITKQKKKKRFIRETAESYRVRIIPKTQFTHFVSEVINPKLTLVYGS